VLGQIEPPLFEAVLDYTSGNQSRAAEILGLNRATLRKKLKQYELLS
jgi:Fis family transcriptional regulator